MKYVQVKSITDLESGQIIRGKLSGNVYIVTGNYGDRVTAVQTADVTNPDEWELLIIETLADLATLHKEKF